VSLSRREFILTSSAALAAVPFARLAHAQQPAAPQTAFKTLRRNVGYFTGRGGTIGWLSNKDVLVVVDTQYPDTAKICLEGLPGRGARTIDRVFNTHHHADHTGGNGVFRPAATKIVAQEHVPTLQREAYGASDDPQVYADATFGDTWSERLGDETVTASYHGPAHTGGDSVVHFERANVLHLGDLVWVHFHPFIDRPGGASIQNWIKILESTATRMPGGTIYLAGHAKRGMDVRVDRQALLTQRDYFDAALTHAQRGIQQRKSRDEIVSLAALKGFEDYQSSPPRIGLAATLGAAYDELTSASAAG
jgi:glyoxylase-like metal-dependent hydrolase (beta-lactamase superfamily II)